jgi:AbrB family looped-hinge helix DNA binding protein
MTSKGQVTIPKELRERLGLEAGAILEFVEDDHGRIMVTRAVGNGALGALSHRAPKRPVSVDQMRQALRRRARAKAGTGR